MVEKLSVSLLEHHELTVTATRVLNQAEQITAADTFIKAHIALTKKDVETLEGVLNKDKDNEYTEILSKQDQERDDAFVFLKKYIAAFFRKKENLKQAGELLYGLIKKQGLDLHKENYVVETAKLKALFTSFEATDAKAALTLLGADNWLDDLKAAQEKFEDIYNQKVSAEIKENYPLLRETRQKLTFHLTTLLNNITIIEELKPVETADDVKKINEIISDMMTTVRARKTREANKDKSEE